MSSSSSSLHPKYLQCQAVFFKCWQLILFLQAMHRLPCSNCPFLAHSLSAQWRIETHFGMHIPSSSSPSTMVSVSALFFSASVLSLSLCFGNELAFFVWKNFLSTSLIQDKLVLICYKRHVRLRQTIVVCCCCKMTGWSNLQDGSDAACCFLMLRVIFDSAWCHGSRAFVILWVTFWFCRMLW